MTKLDVSFARSRFPSLKSGYVYMDNAGGSQTLESVAHRITQYLLETNVQLGATYEISKKSTKCVDDAEQLMQQYVNARDVDEIIMGGSTSLLLKTVANVLGKTFSPGDEVIVTNADHEANVHPWKQLEKIGIIVKEWKLNSSLQLDIKDLKSLLSNKTRLVAVTHASNLLGYVNPIKEIAQICRENNTLTCVDGVAFAPHRPIDVQQLGVDLYSFSFYKVFGPHYACLYARENVLSGLCDNFDFIDEGAYRLQPGNVNFELAHGNAQGIMDYFRSTVEHHFPEEDHSNASVRSLIDRSFELFSEHERTLSEMLLKFLRSKDSVRIIGDSDSGSNRLATISFITTKCDSEQVTLAVDKHDIGIRFGDFYAKSLVQSLKLDSTGVVRVSLVHYNTVDEVAKLITVFDQIL